MLSRPPPDSSSQYSDLHANVDADCYADDATYRCSSSTHSDFHGNADCGTYSDSDGNTLGAAISYPNINAHPHPYGNTDVYPDIYPDVDTDGNSDIVSNVYPDIYPNKYTYRYTDCYAYK